MRLRFIVLFLLLSVFMLFTSCSFAYTFDDFIYFCETIQPDATQFNNSIQRIINSENALKSSIGANVYKTFIVEANNSGGYTTLLCTNNNITISSNNGQSIGLSSSTRFDTYQIKYSNGSITKSYINKSSIAINSYYGILETTNNWTNWGNGYFNNKWVEPYYGPVFSPVYNGNINVYYSGDLVETATRLPFGYVFPNVSTLGYLSDYQDNFWALDISFSVVNAIDSNTFFSDKLASYNYNLYTGSNSNGIQFDFSSGKLSVSSSLLIPNQLYFLTIYYKNTSSDDWIYIGDKDFSYYSYFFTTNISSGDAISPDLVKTLSPELINTLKEIGDNNPNYSYIINNNINLVSGDINSIDFPSGDLVSGDFFGINYHDYDDFGFGDFVYRFFYGLYYVLTDYNNVSVDFGFLGVINSSQFVISEPFLASFVSLFTNAFLIIVLIWFYYYFIKHISILDLEKIFKYDVDHLFDLF